jgi:hypothetical protein
MGHHPSVSSSQVSQATSAMPCGVKQCNPIWSVCCQQKLVAPSNALITQCPFLVSPIPWETAQEKPSLPRIRGHRFGSPPNGPGRSRPAQSEFRPNQTVSNDLNFHPPHLFSVICIHHHHRTATKTWSKTRQQKRTARSQNTTPEDQASTRTVFLSHTRQANETTGIHHTNFRVPQHENFPMIENDADSRHSFPDPVFIISDSLLVGKRTQTKERQ